MYKNHENLPAYHGIIHEKYFTFVSGFLIYRIHRNIKVSPNLAKYLLYIVMICYGFYWYDITSEDQYYYKQRINNVLFGAILILDIESKHENLVAKALSFRPITFLGEVSFSMYLV